MKRPLALAVAALALAGHASAQMSAGPRSVAMGGGGMVFATGVDAVEWNPANLGWAGGWNFSLFEVGVVGLGTGASLSDLRDMYDGDDAEARAALARLPDSGYRLSSVTEGFTTAYGASEAGVPEPGSPLPTVGVAVGPVAFRIRSRVFADANVSKEVMDLIALGFEQERLQEYAVGNTSLREVSLTEFTLSYGFEVGALAVGLGGRYVQGHSLLDGRFFEPEATITSDTTFWSLRSAAVESQSGTGYGLDVGLSIDLPAGFRLSGAGTNVIQQMDWDDELVAWTARFDDQDFEDFELEDFFDEYADEPVDPNSVSLAVFQAGEELFTGSYFPQVYRGGLGWQSGSGGTTLEANAIVVSPRGRFSSPWDERIAFGIEQKIPLLTLRGGYAKAQEGLSAITAGLALRLGPVHLELSGGQFNGGAFDVDSWDGAYGSVGLQIKGGGR